MSHPGGARVASGAGHRRPLLLCLAWGISLASPVASLPASAASPLRSASRTAVPPGALATAGVARAPSAAAPDVDALLARMTLEEKVGQLLLLGFGGTEMDDTIASFLRAKKPGGVALFGRNIKSLPQTLKLVRAIRALDPAGIPTFISVDQEGGKVVRLLQKATVIPSNMALGAANDEALAREAGGALGKDLSRMGFNMNLAPVLDVNTNPQNPVIGTRSFGSDPERVARLGAAYVEGLQAEGIAAVAKHFPGHGDTATDSHVAMPVLPHDRDRLRAVELLPFARAIDHGLDAIMTAHIALPAIAEDKELPATVSHAVLTGLLREELGYQGLVITDGLEMHGIVSRYGSGEAAVQAVLAGADMVMVLWFAEKKDEVHHALLEAARSGKISPERLDASVRRVLRAKARRGLFGRRLLPVDDALAALDEGTHRQVVTRIAREAITLVRNEGALLPLTPGPRTLVVASEGGFARRLQRALPRTDIALVPANASAARLRSELSKLKKRVTSYERVVLGFMGDEALPLMRGLRAAAPAVPMVAVSFASPYWSGELPDMNALVCAFGFREESERAAADVLLGKEPPRGEMPVHVDARVPLGHGLAYPANDAAGDGGTAP